MNYYMASQNVQEILKLHFSVLSQVCVCVCVCVCARACGQSYPTLYDPMDCSPPSSSIHGIIWARILQWVAISFSRGSSQPRNQTCFSCISCIGGRFFTICTIYEGTSSHTVQPLMISPYPRWQPCNTTVASILLK